MSALATLPVVKTCDSVGISGVGRAGSRAVYFNVPTCKSANPDDVPNVIKLFTSFWIVISEPVETL